MLVVVLKYICLEPGVSSSARPSQRRTCDSGCLYHVRLAVSIIAISGCICQCECWTKTTPDRCCYQVLPTSK